jgi:hypothetical protein
MKLTSGEYRLILLFFKSPCYFSIKKSYIKKTRETGLPCQVLSKQAHLSTPLHRYVIHGYGGL